MTSSKRHLKPDQPLWSMKTQKLKDGDMYSETDLISVIVLACKRPEITQQCLASTLRALKDYKGEIEWIFIENGECEENYRFFKSLDLERKVIIQQSNYGICEGLNQGLALSRGEYIFVLENDWICNVQDEFLTKAIKILKSEKYAGAVQLRAIHDPNENWGIGKPEYSPWSCTIDRVQDAGFTLIERLTDDNQPYLLANHPNGYNNNPIIIKKSILRQMGPMPEAEIGADPRHGESEYQQIYREVCQWTAHILTPIYYHAGQKTTPF